MGLVSLVDMMSWSKVYTHAHAIRQDVDESPSLVSTRDTYGLEYPDLLLASSPDDSSKLPFIRFQVEERRVECECELNRTLLFILVAKVNFK